MTVTSGVDLSKILVGQNLRGNVVKTDKCMGVSQLLGRPQVYILL